MHGPPVLVLGVGDTLVSDDGVGMWAIQALADAYVIPAHVRIFGGGAAVFGLLDEIGEAAFLLIVDAAKWGGAPGSIYRFEHKAFTGRRGPFFSVHEIGVVQIRSALHFSGKLPKTRVIGVEPLDAESVGLDLTEPRRTVLPEVVAAIVEELADIGVVLRAKPPSGADAQMPQDPSRDTDAGERYRSGSERDALKGQSRRN